jgi:predicted unusual protein kinase regulating ubiquinone biosynthesis (AarF/ABC1/UbiB family)
MKLLMVFCGVCLHPVKRVMKAPCGRQVRRIITQDLGAPPEKLFKHFNPNPIASASLAQVRGAVQQRP